MKHCFLKLYSDNIRLRLFVFYFQLSIWRGWFFFEWATDCYTHHSSPFKRFPIEFSC